MLSACLLGGVGLRVAPAMFTVWHLGVLESRHVTLHHLHHRRSQAMSLVAVGVLGSWATEAWCAPADTARQVRQVEGMFSPV